MNKKFITIGLITLFSILLWIIVSLSNDYFTTLELPVKYVGIPNGSTVANPSTKNISVSLKGQGWLLAKLSIGGNPDFTINVNTGEGEQSVQTKNSIESNSWLTSSLQLVQISPQKLTYTVEPLSEKKISINPEFELDFAAGYDLVSNITLEPDSATITGSVSELKKINYLTLEKLNKTKIKANVKELLNIVKLGDIKINPEKVLVSFDVQKIVDKTVFDVPVEKKKVPYNQTLEIFPQKIQVSIRGGINNLTSIEAKHIKAYLTFQEALNDTLGSIIPTIELPPFIQLLSIKPGRLSYIIKKY